MPFFSRLPVSKESGTDYQSAANFRQIVAPAKPILQPSHSSALKQARRWQADAID
jgi:hypothetical protein